MQYCKRNADALAIPTVPPTQPHVFDLLHVSTLKRVLTSKQFHPELLYK